MSTKFSILAKEKHTILAIHDNTYFSKLHMYKMLKLSPALLSNTEFELSNLDPKETYGALLLNDDTDTVNTILYSCPFDAVLRLNRCELCDYSYTYNTGTHSCDALNGLYSEGIQSTAALQSDQLFVNFLLLLLFII